MGTGPLCPEARGLHSLASLEPLASLGPGAVCRPAWPQSLPASSAKDRPTVRAKDSLAWPSGAGFQDSGILNQLLWQVWPAQLSRGTGRPESCQPAAGGCGAAGLAPRPGSKANRGRTGLGEAAGPRTHRVHCCPTRAETAAWLLWALRTARVVGWPETPGSQSRVGNPHCPSLQAETRAPALRLSLGRRALRRWAASGAFVSCSHLPVAAASFVRRDSEAEVCRGIREPCVALCSGPRRVQAQRGT